MSCANKEQQVAIAQDLARLDYHSRHTSNSTDILPNFIDIGLEQDFIESGEVSAIMNHKMYKSL